MHLGAGRGEGEVVLEADQKNTEADGSGEPAKKQKEGKCCEI
jgi:hypothetical protein